MQVSDSYTHTHTVLTHIGSCLLPCQNNKQTQATSDLCEVLKKQTVSSGESSTTTAPGTTNTAANNNNISNNRNTALLDSATERQICTAVLRLLHDPSNDVQAVAVKTLGVLLTVTGTEQVLEIADCLADQVLDVSKSELRDVYAIGLRTLVKTCPSSMGDQVSQRLLGRLLEGCRDSSTSMVTTSTSSTRSSTTSASTTATTNTPATKEEIVLACLDILSELLNRFGASSHAATRQHEPILTQCLHHLQSSATSPLIRKRAGHTLACLSTVLSDPLLQRMVEALLRDMTLNTTNNNSNDNQSTRHAAAEDARSLIRTLCQIAGVGA